MSSTTAKTEGLPEIGPVVGSFNALGTPTKVLIGATFAIAFLDGGFIALAFHTAGGWAAYRINDSMAQQRLEDTIEGLQGAVEVLQEGDKDSPDVLKFKGMINTFEADKAVIKLSSVLIAVGAFISPALGAVVLLAAYGVHKVVLKAEMDRLEEYLKTAKAATA